MRLSSKKNLTKLLLYFVFLVIIVFFLFPILWTFSLSLKSIPELFEIPPSLIPDSFLWENYKYVLTQCKFGLGIWNSIIISIGTIIGTLIITIPAAYCFSRLKFRFSRQLQLFILMFQLISPLVAIIPLYKYFNKMGLLNTRIAVIIVCIATSAPLQVHYLKGFMDTIPKEMDDAAMIDGCTRMGTLTRVVLPTIAPGVLSSVLLIFISAWSQFIIPYVLIDKASMMPAAVRLANLQSSLREITTHYLAAASILSIVPVIILFVLLQKFIVSALTEGAVKG